MGCRGIRQGAVVLTSVWPGRLLARGRTNSLRGAFPVRLSGEVITIREMRQL